MIPGRRFLLSAHSISAIPPAAVITERNGRLCEWRDLSQRSRAEAENKAAESAGEKASVRGKYWRPDLNRSEWNLLNRRLEEEIESSGRYLDESTKWLYADEKGVQVFALYGIGDGTEATPLYAVGGKQARYAASLMQDVIEEVGRSDGNAEGFDSWAENLRSKNGNYRRNYAQAGDGKPAGRNAGLHGRSQGRNTGKPAGDGKGKSSGVKEKFSLRDSAGRELTAAQQDYFKDSKVRDAAGRLKVMYRGGNGDFTVFDRRKSKYSNLYGRGFYFTDSESHAKQYGNARAFYLNITNPVSTTETSITRAQLRKFLEAVAGNEDDFSFEDYGYGATVDSVLKSTYGKSDFFMLYDVNQTAIGDMVQAVELFNEVNGTNYNGLILDSETVAFHSNQIKNTDNKTPSSDPDIRYSARGKYWRPQLRDAEWTLLNRKLDEGIESSEQYLDESTKWLYADEKGVQVFALYGIGDGTEATPLYASGGKTAMTDRQTLIEAGKEFDYGVDRDTETLNRMFKTLRRKQGDGYGSVFTVERGGTADGYGRVSAVQEDGNGRGSSGAGTQNQRRVKEKFSLREPVERTKDLVAVHNLTEQNLRDAFYLGGLPMPSIAVVKAALEKLPVYRGTVYRHYDFGSFGGYDAMAEFLSMFEKGKPTPMKSYLSASTVRNEDRTGGEYTVDMVIQSKTGRSLDGFGRNTENEVLLPRTTELIADSMELISPHKVRIIAREVIKNGEGATADAGAAGMRDVREGSQGLENMRPVSGRNSEEVQGQGRRDSGRDRDAGLSGLREGTRPGSLGESGVESDYRAAEEGLKYQPREQSVSDRRRSRYCQRTEFELLFARGRGRIDTYRHKRRTDHGRKEKANFQRDSALRGADARLIYGRD